MKEDKSYGIIVAFQNKFLLVKHKAGHWGFPKGHKEGSETDEGAARRELQEETGLSDCEIIPEQVFYEEYEFFDQGGERVHKIVKYFLGSVKEDKVFTQEGEISDYKWASFEEALGVLTFSDTRNTLKQAKNILSI